MYCVQIIFTTAVSLLIGIATQTLKWICMLHKTICVLKDMPDNNF